MLELSLFTGAGGGLLGTKLLGWRCVGAVEFAEYPCKVLAQRQTDGVLDDFPIWHMDIREFNRRIAPTYTGLVDVISAGFPCQPFSVAGKQRGADDERNMWPATIECIRIVRPRFCLLENVPGLISNGYLATVLGDLAACGYDARWRVLSAAELGAPHKRDRLWIAAIRGGDVADAAHGGDMRGYGRMENAKQQYDTGRSAENGCGQWWAAEPGVGRVANGVAARVDRLKAIGNGQVPAVAATAWRLLMETL